MPEAACEPEMHICFPKRKDPQANTHQIVALARIVAVGTGSLVPLLESAPNLDALLQGRSSEDWDFLATVASVGAGMYDAYQRLPTLDIPSAEIAVRHSLTHWGQQGYDAYLDFGNFVGQNVDSGIEFQTAVGAWVLWNIKAAEPTADELAAAPLIGRMSCGQMAGSWESTGAKWQ